MITNSHSINLKGIQLPGINLRTLPLNYIGTQSSSAPRDLYKRILNSMPSALRESLVAWYSPNLQGLTNAELADSLNEYVDGLHDLSGNGNHMTLYNFSGVGPEANENGNGGGYVNADGDLGFDGVDDEAVGTIPDVAVVVTADGQTAVDSEDITLGVNGSGVHVVMTLVERIYFDRELNEEELTWVLENMTGENAHVDTKYNQVTLYCGEFDDDGTLIDDSYDVFTFSVQHGNSLFDADGNLLAKYHKDIDATHCTSDTWYDTDGLEYAGEAITEDTTFYCERQLIYEHMLEQLDALTLSDGTSAKEHLVCWYQPKLQGLTKESVLADKVLADLSGNGYDMTLYGFTEDEECIKNGHLYYDGIDDCGVSVGKTTLTDYHILMNISGSYINKDCYIFNKDGVKYTNMAFMVNTPWRNTSDKFISYISFGYLNKTKQINTDDAIVECTPTSISLNGYRTNCSKGTYSDENSAFVMGKTRVNNSVFTPFKLAMICLFDLTLTTDELTQVKQILKLS